MSENRQTQSFLQSAVNRQQVKTSGNKEHFITDIYWLVVTDKGTFHARTGGYFVCAEATALQKDSTYTLTIDGFFQSSFLGVYPFITKVHKK
ncbi:MAG: hypothetical protein NC344_05675 [Bacteroidales bacterium]|nr:hypothetical protein [Bacteroidales bacterium]